MTTEVNFTILNFPWNVIGKIKTSPKNDIVDFLNISVFQKNIFHTEKGCMRWVVT